ncbi:MAG: ammonium transporter, partial [Anaerolineae bacterium]|nr:ammonium transporter [Anaerolineae bacterium]
MKRLSFTLVKRLSVVVAVFLVLLALTGGKAFAQEDGPTTGEIVIQLDVIWLFIGAFLVFWMQAGFAMVESGFSRSKNAANLLMKNLLDFAVGTIVFFAIGFGLMYGDSAGGFIGTSNFFLSDIAITPDAAYDWVDFLFQLMFAAAAATIVSGAVAERLKFKSYLV